MGQICRQSEISFGARVQNRLQRHLKKLIRTANYGSRIHEFRLRGKHPLRLLGTPNDPGIDIKDPDRKITDLPDDWQGENRDRREQEYLHSFCWLRDLNQQGDRKAARQKAIALTRDWLKDFDCWHEVAWAADILGQRIFYWLAYAPLILDSTDLVYRSKMLNCLARQARHLHYIGDDGLRGLSRIEAVTGLMLAGLYIPHGESWLKKATGLLDRALMGEILADGGEVSRNPQDMLDILQYLVVIRASLRAMGHDLPARLVQTIPLMAGMLDALRHGDGALALFNGAKERTAAELDTVLSLAGLSLARALARGDKTEISPAIGEKSGFRRLQRGATVVILDAGPPADMVVSKNCHAGTLSFEMSDGPQRIIVNCGSAKQGSEDDLYRLCRSTAAHSTLIVKDRNSSEIRKDGLIGCGPAQVTSKITLPEQGPGLVEAGHDGYLSRFGVLHRRTIYISEAGDDVRGEDILDRGKNGGKSQQAVGYDIRFHLHPAVSLTRQEAPDRLLLGVQGAHYWQFHCAGGQLAVEESLYLGDGNTQTCRQIVISGRAGDEKTVIKWSLRRMEQKA